VEGGRTLAFRRRHSRQAFVVFLRRGLCIGAPERSIGSIFFPLAYQAVLISFGSWLDIEYTETHEALAV
jgi:hypothetical protein